MTELDRVRDPNREPARESENAHPGTCPRHEGENVIGLCGACDVFVCALDSLVIDETVFCRSCAGSADSATLEVIASARSRSAGTGGGRHGRARRPWRPFEEARAFARSLGLKSTAEWIAYAKGAMPEKGRRPDDIPSIPRREYAEHWRGIADWLGIPEFFVPPRPFEEARAFVRTLGLKNIL